MRWPWQKADPPSQPTVTAPAPAPMGWAFLPPLQRTVADPVLVSRPHSFPPSLPAWRDPSFASHELSHLVSADAPSGVVDGDLTGTPSVHGDSAPLTLPPPSPPSSSPAVQRAAVVPAPEPSLTRTTVASLPVVEMASLPAEPPAVAEAEPLSTPDPSSPDRDGTDEPVDPPRVPHDRPLLGAGPEAETVQRSVAPAAAPATPTVQRRVGLGAPLAALPRTVDGPPGLAVQRSVGSGAEASVQRTADPVVEDLGGADDAGDHADHTAGGTVERTSDATIVSLPTSPAEASHPVVENPTEASHPAVAAEPPAAAPVASMPFVQRSPGTASADVADSALDLAAGPVAGASDGVADDHADQPAAEAGPTTQAASVDLAADPHTSEPETPTLGSAPLLTGSSLAADTPGPATAHAQGRADLPVQRSVTADASAASSLPVAAPPTSPTTTGSGGDLASDQPTVAHGASGPATPSTASEEFEVSPQASVLEPGTTSAPLLSSTPSLALSEEAGPPVVPEQAAGPDLPLLQRSVADPDEPEASPGEGTVAGRDASAPPSTDGRDASAEPPAAAPVPALTLARTADPTAPTPALAIAERDASTPFSTAGRDASAWAGSAAGAGSGAGAGTVQRATSAPLLGGAMPVRGTPLLQRTSAEHAPPPSVAGAQATAAPATALPREAAGQALALPSVQTAREDLAPGPVMTLATPPAPHASAEASPTLQTALETTSPAAGAEALTGGPVLQTSTVVQTAEAAPAAAPAAPAAGGKGGSPEEMEALAQKLLAPMMRRIRAEMLLDRERRGLRTDAW